MDKRNLFAVLLIAVVLIVPMFFRSQRQPLRPGVGATTSATAAVAVDTAVGARTGAPASSRAVDAPASALASGPAIAAAPPPDATSAAAASPRLPAETTTVATPEATYSFSSVGATPTQIALAKYESRRPGATGTRAAIASIDAPLLRFRLLTRDGRDTTAFDALPFTTAQTGDRVTFTSTTTPRVTVSYDVGMNYLTHITGRIEGDPEQLRDARLLVDLPPGLRSQEADSADDIGHLAYAARQPNNEVRTVSFGKLEPTLARTDSGPFDWVAARNKYFVVALLTPKGAAPFTTTRMHGEPKVDKLAPRAASTADLPIAGGQFALDMYAGPQSWPALRAVGRELENVNPYGGWIPGVQPLATICMRVLLWMRATLNVSYGWVLVIFGIAIRLILWPLNQSAMRSSMKMQRIQPELMQARKLYGSDAQKFQEETMKIYRAHGMSQFSALGGCLPMLLPMPVLFALFFIFQNTIEFRGVSFLWLPDLSLHDPYYITPIFMGLSMAFLSWLGMRGVPPNPQAKMMGFMMPVVMTTFLLKFPAGLNLYYAVQNVASLPQQWLISRERAKAGPPPAAPAAAPLRGKRAAG